MYELYKKVEKIIFCKLNDLTIHAVRKLIILKKLIFLELFVLTLSPNKKFNKYIL